MSLDEAGRDDEDDGRFLGDGDKRDDDNGGRRERGVAEDDEDDDADDDDDKLMRRVGCNGIVRSKEDMSSVSALDDDDIEGWYGEGKLATKTRCLDGEVNDCWNDSESAFELSCA